MLEIRDIFESVRKSLYGIITTHYEIFDYEL